MESNRNKKKIKEYSYIRSLACMGIIFIHVLTSGIAKYSTSISTSGLTSYWCFVDCLKWGVPCFVMVSGILLLNPEKEITYKKLFSKYVARILKAIIAFGILFAVLETIFADGGSRRTVFLDGLYDVFGGTSWAHMWYLYCLIGLYLLLPFYRMIAAHCRKQDMQYLLITYLIFLSVIPLLKSFGLKCGFYIHVSSVYPFWLFLGYYLKKWGFQRNSAFYAVLAVAGSALLIIFTVVRWNTGLEAMADLFNYSSVLVVIQTIGLIGLFQKMKIREDSPLDRFLSTVDTHSFGIYLIHMVVIWFAYTQLDWNPFIHGGFFGVLLLAVAAFLFGMIMDAILRRLPLFRGIL